MNIKKTFTFLAGLLLFASMLFGQAATVSTTLSVATNSTITNVTLASATHVQAGGFLYMDREVMAVLSSYTSGTLVPVARGNSGTKATSHNVSIPVYVFAPGNEARVGLRSGQEPGSDPSGACVATNQAILPMFNTTFGTRFDCVNSQWVRTGSAGNVIYCGSTTGSVACVPATGVSAIVIAGKATLASNTAVITGLTPAFTSTSTYSCVGNDITTRANPVQVVATSASSITITNTTGASDVISWSCSGY